MNQSNDSAHTDFVSGNGAGYCGNGLLFLLNVALGRAKLQNAQMDAPVMPSVQHPRASIPYPMELDEPQMKTEDLEVGDPQLQNVEPARLDTDPDPWTKGYITDSGRRVVPVKKYIAPGSPPSSGSQRSTSSTCRSSRRYDPRKFGITQYKCPGCDNIYYNDSALANHLLDVLDCQEAAGPPETWGPHLHEFRLMAYATPRQGSK